MNIDAIRERSQRCEEARDAGEGTVGAYGWAAAAIASAADVPLLIEEISNLRAEAASLRDERDAARAERDVARTEVARWRATYGGVGNA